MCLAIPGKIISIDEDSQPFFIEADTDLLRIGRVSFGGVVKTVSLAYVPEAKVGDYVSVHVGFALNVLDQAEAEETLQYIQKIGETAFNEQLV